MNAYLQKRALYPPLIADLPDQAPGLIVVIPCFQEPDLLNSLEALKACTLPEVPVEVIAVFNHSEKAAETIKAQNRLDYLKANEWAQTNSISGLRFFCLFMENLPAKHAGVGLARKIGMDEALYRFQRGGLQEGIILAFDADSDCSPDFLVETCKAFESNPEIEALSIFFEHPLEGEAFSEATYRAITEYELHLRYFINMQRKIAFPLAYQTIGSSMAVRASAYAAEWGMNRRKAGEDFYFLHKFIKKGRLAELNSCAVYPSPRKSDRVPFGTGKAVGDLLEQQEGYRTYAPGSFQEWGTLISLLPTWFAAHDFSKIPASLPEALLAFLLERNFSEKLSEIRSQSSDAATFRKRFFQWMDAFQLMKFLHFKRDHGATDVPVCEAAAFLLNSCGQLDDVDASDPKQLLIRYRQLDRAQPWWSNEGALVKL